jgi:hypothetical protein
MEVEQLKVDVAETGTKDMRVKEVFLVLIMVIMVKFITKEMFQ